MLKITVIGAAGRMGREIIRLIQEASDLTLAGAIEADGHPALGQDAAACAGLAACGISITSALHAGCAAADVVIDFSAPGKTAAHARTVADCNSALVVGTTGLAAADLDAMADLAADGARIVCAPNMSVGINLLFELCKQVAQVLDIDYNIEVVEMHHRDKVDAPSGTAVRLGEILAANRSLAYPDDVRFGRSGMVGKRPGDEIGIHALRGGDVVGDHTVIFAGDGERVELTHKASSRATFAKGALRAARYIATAPNGVYDMQDVLGLSNSRSGGS